MPSDDSAAPVTITETRDLLGVLELEEIRFFGLSADALSPADTDADDDDHGDVDRDEGAARPVEFLTAHRFYPEGADYRVLMTVRTPTLLVRVDAAAMYASEVPLEVSDEVLVDFGDNVAIMTLFPYMRQAVTDLGQRLGEQVVLPVLPRGVLSFTSPLAEDAPQDESAGSAS